MELSGSEIKKCGQCKRRVYCSRECQRLDWLPTGGGQGHKNWCTVEYGEEDLDWFVTDIPGKGLGIKAKRNIPALYRIIVDGPRSVDFSAVQDLMPHGGSPEEKFHFNKIATDEGESVLCLRISRVNHSCRENAFHYWDRTFKVKILFSEREIQEGEEICFSYKNHTDISAGVSFEYGRSILNLKWGIRCPPTCLCYDHEAEKIKNKCFQLDKDIMDLAVHGQVEKALTKAKSLLKYEEENGYSWCSKKRTLYDAFQVAIMKKKTLKEGEEYIRKVCEIMHRILHPDSEDCRKYDTYAKTPSSHRNYLISD